MTPPVTAMYMLLDHNPRRRRGAISARYVNDPAISPPRPNPCASRATTSRTDATTPTLVYVGATPMMIEEPAVTTIATVMEKRRPCRSANRPK